MPARKYDDETRDHIAELRERGLSYKEISAKTGVKTSSISAICTLMGVVAPGAKLPNHRPKKLTAHRGNHIVRRFTDEEDARLLSLEAQGFRYCEIARKLGRRPNSVKGRLMTLARRDAVSEGQPTT